MHHFVDIIKICSHGDSLKNPGKFHRPYQPLFQGVIPLTDKNDF